MRYYLLNLYLGRVAAAALLDVACFASAAVLTWVALQPPFAPLPYALWNAAAGLGLFALLYYTDAYGLTVLGSGRRTLGSVAAAGGVVLMTGLLGWLVFAPSPRLLEVAAHTAGLAFPLILGGRLAFRVVSARPRFSQRVLIVGASDLALAIARAVRERRNLGAEIAGFLSDDFEDQGAWLEGYPVLGPVHGIEKVLEREQVGRVVVASKRRDEHFPAQELLQAKLAGRRVESGVSFYERVTGKIYLRDLRASYLIFSPGFRNGRLSLAAKRVLDLLLAGAALFVLWPILLVAALAVKLDSRGPAFFTQERVGRFGRTYRLYKLRSMRVDAEERSGPAWALPDDERMTRVGRLLRKARLDEIPQLWNVIQGEMSLVGPRPERPEFVQALSERYPYFRARFALPPGITGWAQIRQGYVNDLSAWEEKLALDLYYMKYRSLSMDVLILWRTVKTVFLLNGV